MQVPREQIAEVLCFDLPELEAIIENEDFKQFNREFLAEEFSRAFGTVRSWDDVEAKALKAVSEALDLDPEPDFALRAAMTANKANRHGFGKRVDPLDLQAGARRVINLKTTFVEKIENNTVVLNNNDPKTKLIDNGSKKVIDAMPLQDLKQIMGNEEPNDADVIAAVEDIL